MKKINFIGMIFLIATFGCNNVKKTDFVYLNSEQLKPLGIEVNEFGVFYKNFNPKWIDDNEKYPILGFIATNETYLSTMHYNENDTLKAEDKIDSLFVKMELTKNDFYPILIGSTKGKFSLDREEKNIKLLPIAICMEETKLTDRKDTLIIWFKPTESISNALPKDINIVEFIKFPDSTN